MELYLQEFTLTPLYKIDTVLLLDFYSRNKDFLQQYEAVRENHFYTIDYHNNLRLQDEIAYHNKSSIRFAVCHKDNTDKIIGIVGINNIVWGSFLSAFLGYKMDKDYINKGYMTEIIKVVVDYAFDNLGLHRIEANIMPKNLPSIRVVEKCGFNSEGISTKYLKINGIWEDHIHYVKLNEKLH